MSGSRIDLRRNKELGDLYSKVESSKHDPQERGFFPVEDKWDDFVPYWTVVRQNTMDPGVTDWSTEFFPDTTTSSVSNRVVSRSATAGGELTSTHPNGGSSYGARHFAICVWSKDWQTVPCYASFTGTGVDVQRKFNGEITAMVGPNDFYFDLTFPPGYSFLSFSSETLLDYFAFEGLLFDGVNSHWHDPNKPRNPVRGNFTSTGGGSGSGDPGLSVTIPS